MAEELKPAAQPDASAISEDALRKAEEFIEADEGAINRLSGLAGQAVTAIAVVMSLFHLYAAVAGAWPFSDFPIIATQPLRYAHVAFVLVLSFLLFPMAARFRNRIRWFDVVLGVAGAAILVYAIDGGEGHVSHSPLSCTRKAINRPRTQAATAPTARSGQAPPAQEQDGDHEQAHRPQRGELVEDQEERPGAVRDRVVEADHGLLGGRGVVGVEDERDQQQDGDDGAGGVAGSAPGGGIGAFARGHVAEVGQE